MSTMSLPVENIFSGPATEDSSSNLASSSSTPPTTVADSASLHSDTSKHDVITVAEDAVLVTEPAPAPSPARERRARASASGPVYNLARLSGTAGHGKRRANGDDVVDRRRRTISGDTLVTGADAPGSARRKSDRVVREGIDALDLRWSPGGLNSPRTRRQARESPRSLRASSRMSVADVSTFSSKLSTLGKRSRKAMDKGVTKMTREMRRLQDTKEFSHIDEKPVVHTVWANGKFVDPKAPAPPARKKVKVETKEEAEKEDSEPITNTRKRRVKKYLDKGLYAGQEMPSDITKGLTAAEKKKLTELPELKPSGRVNNTFPEPIFTGFRMLLSGRDFKLPYRVCNPLPPGQPKPDEWKKMTKNRFIGDSKEYWRKTPHILDYQSKCVCTPDDGCGESCQNRIMLYECDKTNCNVGPAHCTNRAFADLTARRAKGGKYRVGVEVIKTSDRGYGVRSNRAFRPNQIIMEYAGEIITEEECERRMNEVYKDNECYYLMSFDQNMIIDATTGSIARFVNHSCNPNSRMIKWIVSGQPRMALFAGDKPISTGDELTYDYNFDPFSAKNVQGCLCGEHNCRGVLGPRPREVKPPKADLKKVVKAAAKAGKRKLKELVGDDKATSNKKRKIQPAKGVKRSISTASLKAAKGAATALKKSLTATGKKGAAAKAKPKAKSPVKRKPTAGALLKATATKHVVKTYGRTPSKKKVESRSSSLTIVAMGDDSTAPKKTTPKGKTAVAKKTVRKTPVKKKMGVKVTPKSAASARKVVKKTAEAKPAPEITVAMDLD